MFSSRFPWRESQDRVRRSRRERADTAALANESTLSPPPSEASEHGSTSGIALRPISRHDAPELQRVLLENRSWLSRWEATYPGMFGVVDARATVRALLDGARAGTGIPYVVILDGKLVGQLNVSSVAYGSLSSASIGYWIAESAAGRGVIPTAVALATDYCFQRAGLHRIEICIRPENAPSLRVVEKLGFRYEGLRRRLIHINGGWRDHFTFAITTEDVPQGVLARWRAGLAPPGAAAIPLADRQAATTSNT